MKTVHFAKPWRVPLTETSYQEYPVGEATLSNAKADRAAAEGYLSREPVESDGGDEHHDDGRGGES